MHDLPLDYSVETVLVNDSPMEVFVFEPQGSGANTHPALILAQLCGALAVVAALPVFITVRVLHLQGIGLVLLASAAGLLLSGLTALAVPFTRVAIEDAQAIVSAAKAPSAT